MLALDDSPTTDMDDILEMEPLTRRVELCLQQSGYPELQNLEVSQGYGRIVLEGQLSTYFLKQLAQSLVLSVPEVHAVENQIDVRCHQ